MGSVAEHAAKHILYSLEFTHVEGLQLVEAVLVSSVESLARSLEDGPGADAADGANS